MSWPTFPKSAAATGAISGQSWLLRSWFVAPPLKYTPREEAGSVRCQEERVRIALAD